MCNSRARRRTSNATPGAQRGLSIIELMVSIVVALLVGLAATGSAITFTASQRVGIGSGGIAVNSATMLSSLKDDVAAAGLGFFGGSQFLCNRINLSMNTTMLMNGASFSPLQVTRTAAGDTVDVFYGDRVEAGASVGLAPGVTAAAAATRSFLPWATTDDTVLLAPTVPGAAATPCTVRTATNSVAAAAGTPQQLSFAGGGKHNKLAFTTNPLASANYAATYLGDLVWSRYRVDATGNLIVERPLTGDSAIIARNVISFRVEYGVAAAAAGGAPINTTLEQWVAPAGAFAALSANNLPRVRALRIGLVVRSPQRERPDPVLGCRATDAAVASAFDPLLDIPTATDWRCFRYRSTQVVVPLRNIVLGLRS
jgi:type IV pilus assembly protein PilW